MKRLNTMMPSYKVYLTLLAAHHQTEDLEKIIFVSSVLSPQIVTDALDGTSAQLRTNQEVSGSPHVWGDTCPCYPVIGQL